MIMPFEAQINKNPELKRNFWLELSSSRLLAMPSIILALFLMVVAVSKRDVGVSLEGMGLGLFVVLVNLWGTKLVIDSIIEEVNDRTWIQQQMTALTPWQMTLGKLFGAPIYAWYGGLMGMAVYLVGKASTTDSMPRAIETILTMIISTIGLHAFAAMTAMLLVRKQIHKPKISSAATYIFVLVLLAFAYDIPLMISRMPSTTWYGLEVDQGHFQLVTAILFSCWTVIGMYRNMRTELQMSSGLRTWIGYLAFAVFYIAGFAFNPSMEKDFPAGVAVFYWGTFTLLALTIVLAYLEPKDAVDRRKLIVAWRDKNWRRVSELMSLWMPTLAATVVFCFLSSIAQLVFGSPDLPGFEGAAHTTLPLLFPLAVAAFLVRDVAFIMLINSTGKRKGPDTTAFVYLAIAHIVIPSIVSIGENKPGLWLFMPTLKGESLLSFLVGAIQAAAMVVWLLSVWRKRNEELEARYAVA